MRTGRTGRFLHLLLAGVTLLGISGCRVALDGLRAVKGSGTPKSEVRQVGDFTALDLGGSVVAEVTVGPAPSLKIETDDNLLEYVATEVRGGKLHIHNKRPVSTTLGLKAWITTPRLDSADVSGASQLDARGVQAERFTLDMSGASRGKFAGQAQALAVDASGACQLDLSGLRAKTAAVDASGASHLRLCVSDEIHGSLSGASELRYGCGSPRLEVDTSGASRVRKDD